MPGFMNKETLEREAQRLGVNLDGLKWPEKQQAVFAALTKEKYEDNLDENLSGADTDGDSSCVSAPFFSPHVEDTEKGQTLTESVHVHVPRTYDPMAPMRGKKVVISPEMAATTNQLFGYDEELDEELIVEEVVHEHDSAYKAGKDIVTGTYTVKEKTGKKVIAHSALPKIGAGIEFYPDRDWVPIVTYKGRKGYLYTHHRLPNIKQLLIESGYYEEYKSRFQHEPNVWHAAGKLLCCDINLANSVLREIERRVSEDKIRNNQNSEYIRKQLG